MKTEIVEWDATTGGRWRYVERCDGVEFGFHGCFHAVSDASGMKTGVDQGYAKLDTLAAETR